MSFDPVEDLKLALIGVLNHNVSLVGTPSKKSIADYKEQRADYYRTLVKNNFTKIRDLAKSLDEPSQKYIEEANAFYERGDAKAMLGVIINISLPKPEKPFINTTQGALKLPHEIGDDIFFDLGEIDRCMKAEAYRSAMILCGRIMETALHRKYYDVTGKDLLETSPGIGLGTVLSKLKESSIEIDPSIAQQIHLINNVRIHSVHKKNTPFQPSKEQAQGTLLFTIDILKKLF